jgi:hypothetical protein
VVEGINPIGKIDIDIVTQEKLSDRPIQIAADKTANDSWAADGRSGNVAMEGPVG